MVNRAEELITQLEAEIVKRDARIAELEKESIKDTKAINDLLASIHELKAQQPSGVVLPERMPWRTLGQATQFKAEGWNACLDEVARLNPCRAVAVPDGYDLDGVRGALAAAHSAIVYQGESTSFEYALSRVSKALHDLAAAPSAQQKESE